MLLSCCVVRKNETEKKQFQEEIYCHIPYHYHYWCNVVITFDQKLVNTFDIKQRPSVLDSTRY
jgi:hypothetical protein